MEGSASVPMGKFGALKRKTRKRVDSQRKSEHLTATVKRVTILLRKAGWRSAWTVLAALIAPWPGAPVRCQAAGDIVIAVGGSVGDGGSVLRAEINMPSA